MLTRCAGQLRIGPSGAVIGLDMVAALNIGAALGYNGRALAELLPATEAGLVAGITNVSGRSHDAIDDGPG